MTQKIFLRIAGSVFGLIAVGHVLRLLFGVDIVIAGRTMPMWPSWFAPFLWAYLAYEGFRLSKKS